VTIDFDDWDNDEGDEYDDFLDAGGTVEELADALGMDISWPRREDCTAR
jgi:hypothetical protein